MKKSNSHRKGQIMLKGIMLSKKMDRGKEMVEEDKKNRNKYTNDIKNKKTIKNQSELFIRRGEIDKDNKKEALIQKNKIEIIKTLIIKIQGNKQRMLFKKSSKVKIRLGI